MGRRATAVMLGLAAGLTGCAHPPKADAPLAACWADAYQPPPPAAAPQDGVYHLKAYGPDGRAGPTPAMTTQLRRHDPLGFRRTDDGQMIAFANDDETPLAAGRYAWALDPQSELRGRRRWGWRATAGLDAVARAELWALGRLLTAACDKLLGGDGPPAD